MPTSLSDNIKNKIYNLLPQILNVIHFQNGPSHVDMKVCDGKIYLIEVNSRGIGGASPGILFEHGIDFDYTKAMIDVALDKFEFPSKINHIKSLKSLLLYKQTEIEFNEVKNSKKIISKNLYRDENVFATQLADISGHIVYEE